MYDSISTRNKRGAFIKNAWQNKWALPLHFSDCYQMDNPRMALNLCGEYVKNYPDHPTPKLELMWSDNVEFFSADKGVPCPPELVSFVTQEIHAPNSGKAVFLIKVG